MAEIVNEPPFVWSQRNSDGYPWDEWLNGSLWRLVAGADFQGDVTVFRRKAYAAAKARDMAVGTKTRAEASEAGPVTAFYLQSRPGAA